MITKKIWKKGYAHKGDYSEWIGYFLFGFIPIYIKQTAYQKDLNTIVRYS